MRTPLRLAVLAVPLLVVSCSKKEQPAPVARQASTTTTTVPPTTLPAPTPTPVPTPPPVWREARSRLRSTVSRPPPSPRSPRRLLLVGPLGRSALRPAGRSWAS